MTKRRESDKRKSEVDISLDSSLDYNNKEDTNFKDKTKHKGKIEKHKIALKNIKSNKQLLSIDIISCEISNIPLHNFNYIIELLKKKAEKRTFDDLSTLMSLLSKSKMAERLRIEKLSEESIKRILISFAFFTKLKIVKPNNYVFYQGDNSDKFYIILDGVADVLIDENYYCNMNPRDYFNFMLELFNRNDIQLMHKINKLNKEIMPIKDDDILIFNQINSILLYYNLLIDFSSMLSTFMLNKDIVFMIHNYKDRFSEFKIANAYSIVEYVNNKYDLTNILTQDIPENNALLLKVIDKELSFIKETYPQIKNNYEYYFSIGTQERKLMLIQRKLIKQLNKGEFFGEIGLESLKNRTASIKASQNSDKELILASVSSYAYKEFLSIESQRISTKNCKILIENFFFKTMSNIYFFNKYFPFFIQKVYQKGTTLFEEKEDFDKLFFIISGKVDLTINKSIINISDYFQSLLRKSISTVSKLKTPESINKKFDNLLLDELGYEKIFNIKTNRNPVLQSKELNEKKSYKVVEVENIAVLGVEEYILKSNWLKNAVVVSNQLIVFELNKDTLVKIISTEEIDDEINLYSLNKLLYFINQIHLLRMNVYDRENLKYQHFIKEGLKNRKSNIDKNTFYGFNIQSSDGIKQFSNKVKIRNDKKEEKPLLTKDLPIITHHYEKSQNVLTESIDDRVIKKLHKLNDSLSSQYFHYKNSLSNSNNLSFIGRNFINSASLCDITYKEQSTEKPNISLNKRKVTFISKSKLNKNPLLNTNLKMIKPPLTVTNKNKTKLSPLMIKGLF